MLEQVVCRAEAVADERPLKFRWQSRWVIVERICDQWLERGVAPAEPTYKVFEVDCELGRCRLRIRREGWVWEMRRLATSARSTAEE